MEQAAPGCCILHPGPVNRGVEIDSALADSAESLILEQVENGVAVRMEARIAMMAITTRSSISVKCFRFIARSLVGWFWFRMCQKQRMVGK